MTRTNAFTTGLAGAATLFLTAAFAAPAASQESVLDRTGRWLGAGGQQLPFTDDQQVLDFLRTAEIVASEEISGTSSDPHKVLLEKDGLRVHAIFRTVEVQRDKLENDVKHARGFRDSYVFEVAAYELSRLLELDNVPPAVVRKVGRQEGSMQLWIEHAMGVAERLESGIREEHAQLWQFQKQNMQIFDSLIYNFDRNPSNILIDHSGKLWFVDPTKATNNAFTLTFGASRGMAEAITTHPDPSVGVVIATSTGLYKQIDYNTGGKPFYTVPARRRSSTSPCSAAARRPSVPAARAARASHCTATASPAGPTTATPCSRWR